MNANPLRMLFLTMFFIAMAAVLEMASISQYRLHQSQPITEIH